MSTYDYYRIFYHVAQQHSFTKAAEVLHNNQPNITRCMNKKVPDRTWLPSFCLFEPWGLTDSGRTEAF